MVYISFLAIARCRKKTDQTVRLGLVRNSTAYAKMIFDKDIMIKRHMDIYTNLSESTLFAYQK